MSNTKQKQEEILPSAGEGELSRDFFIDFNGRYLQFLRGLSLPIRSLITKVIDLEKVNVETESVFLSSFIHYVLPYLDEISSFNQDFFRYSPVRLLYKNHKSLHYAKVLEFMNTEEKHQFWIKLYELWVFFSNNNSALPYIQKHYAHRSFYQAIRVFFENKTSLERQYNGSEAAYQQSLLVREQDSTSSEEEDDTESSSSTDAEPEQENEAANPEEPVPAAAEAAASSSESATNEGENRPGIPPNFPIPGMENSLIGKLAQKISQKVDPKAFEGIREPGDLMGALLGGGNAGLMNMMQTVCSSIDETIKSGEVNQEDLLKEAQSMMGQMGNLTQGLGLGGGGGGGGRGGRGAGGLGNLAGMMNMLGGLGGLGGLANMMGGGGAGGKKKKHGKKK